MDQTLTIAIPIPNLIWYFISVYSIDILLIIVAITMVGIGIYYQVKQKKNKSRNEKLSLWQDNYLRKKYDIDKTVLLQNTGISFVHALIEFAKKWLLKPGANFDTLGEVVIDDSDLIQLLKNAYYTQTPLEKNQEKRVKNFIENLKKPTEEK